MPPAIGVAYGSVDGPFRFDIEMVVGHMMIYT